MVVIRHVAETNGMSRGNRFKGHPSTSKCASTEKKRKPRVRSLRILRIQQYCSEVLKHEPSPKRSEGRGQQSISYCSGTDANGTAADKNKGCAQQSTSNFVGTNRNFFPDGSCVISFQQTCFDVPKNGAAPEKTQGLNPVVPHINSVARLPDLNGSHLSESVEKIPSGGPSADLSKPLTKQGTGGLVTPSVNGVQQMAIPSIPSLKDTSSTLLQNVQKVNYPINGTYHFRTAVNKATVAGPNVVAINSQVISFAQSSVQMEPAGKPEGNERKRRQQVASVIPDLNGNELDANTSREAVPDGTPISPSGMPPSKKGKNKAAGGEDPGGSLILSFAAGCDLPSKESLLATFKRFGLLKESEFLVRDDSTVQIVYERSNEAKFAFRSLERNNPFGEILTNFKLDCTVPDPKPSTKRTNFQMPQPLTAGALRIGQAPQPVGETPDVAFMKQKMEMMKAFLEKQGHTIAPEMRAKLENEIKAFLNRLNATGGSSSQS